MLCTYVMKAFVEQLNWLKVDDDGITPMNKFVSKTIDIMLKNTTHGAAQFMSWVQDWK